MSCAIMVLYSGFWMQPKVVGKHGVFAQGGPTSHIA